MCSFFEFDYPLWFLKFTIIFNSFFFWMIHLYQFYFTMILCIWSGYQWVRLYLKLNPLSNFICCLLGLLLFYEVSNILIWIIHIFDYL
jgi:hypothetical protein